MYAEAYTIPNIAYAMSMLERYQSNLNLYHWKSIMKVMRYEGLCTYVEMIMT